MKKKKYQILSPQIAQDHMHTRVKRSRKASQIV